MKGGYLLLYPTPIPCRALLFRGFAPEMLGSMPLCVPWGVIFRLSSGPLLFLRMMDILEQNEVRRK